MWCVYVPCSKLLHTSMGIVTTEAERTNPFATWLEMIK